MNNKIVSAIMENKEPVRQIIDRFAVNEAPEVDDNAVEGGEELDTNDDGKLDAGEALAAPDDLKKSTHLFVRRFRKDDTEPYKRVRVEDPAKAVTLFFQWADQFKNDKVEVWTDNATDAKNFYRYCMAQRETIEPFWKQSPRLKKEKLLWQPVYRELMHKARQAGAALTGELGPFVVG